MSNDRDVTRMGEFYPRNVILLVSLLLSGGCSALIGQKKVDPLDRIAADSSAKSGILTGTSDRLVGSIKQSLGLGPNEERARESYQQAQQQYRDALQLGDSARQGALLDCASTFAKAAARWPKSVLEEDALFHEGECYFFADRYPKAEAIFGALTEKHPNTRYLDTVSARRFAIAQFWLEDYARDKDLAVTPNLTSRARPVFDKFGNAIKILEQIRLSDPLGKLADDATMAAGAACFQEQKYYRAQEFLSDLRRSYPDSEHQFEAHLLGLRCNMALYQGALYDGAPLEEAETLVKQMRRQFPQEAQEHDQFLTKAWQDVRMNRGIREMEFARYYDRRKEYRAARQHYDKVARLFSDTSLADEAQTRLAQIGEMPDKPGQKLEWLADLFPTPEREKPLVARNPLDALRR